MAEHITLRNTDQRTAQIEALERLTGLTGPAAVVDFALATTLAHYQTQEIRKMTTRTMVARGSEWGEATLNDGWGDVTNEQAGALAELVAERFHELCTENGGTDIDWQPALSEVTAEVIGTGDRMWERVHPMAVNLEDLRDQAMSEVWDAVIGNGGPMAERVGALFPDEA